MLLGIVLTAGCTMIGFGGIDATERLVEAEVTPELQSTICGVLGGPIRWSRNDTQETIDQVEILHNSQWVGFECEELGQ